MSATDIKNLLSQFGLTPNKALGQNFLCDDAVANEIAISGHIDGRSVLEIGPGLGSLTLLLTDKAARVVAVEIDGRMIDALSKRFERNKRLTLIHADFLKFDDEELAHALGGECAVLANLPYYITTPICMKLLCAEPYYRIKNMSLMLQKEAAERFFAKPSDRQYGPLTVLARCYYDVETLMTLSPDMYYPQPEVNSAVITLTRREDVEWIAALPDVLENCFKMRRKTIFNNLKAAYGAENAHSALAASGIAESARAETLDCEAFMRLAEEINRLL